jgi:hypothetical protein
MAEIPKGANGIYETQGLGPKEFNKAFNQIRREQVAKRRKAKRTLTPSILRNKKAEDILSLGRKSKDGVFFSLDELKSFEKSRDALKDAFKSKEKGITYHQLISHAARRTCKGQITVAPLHRTAAASPQQRLLGSAITSPA